MADKKIDDELPAALKPFAKDPEIHAVKFKGDRVTVTGKSVRTASALSSDESTRMFLTHLAGDTFVVVVDPTRPGNLPEYVPITNVAQLSLMRDKIRKEEVSARREMEAKANIAAQRLAAKQAAVEAQGRALAAAEEDAAATAAALEEQRAVEGGFAG